MDKKIKALNIGITVLILIILAMIASDIISNRLSRAFPLMANKNQSPELASGSADLTTFSPILEKGLFGKATQGALTPITRAESPAAVSPGDLLLIGTSVGSFRETFALIQRQSTHEEKVFRLGDKVFDIGPLLTVARNMIEIQSGPSRMKLSTPTATPGATGENVAGASPQQGGLASKVGAGSYIIDQRALSAILDNPAKAMTDARLLPNSKDGKVQGFNVSEVKPSGLFGTIGIKNGDTLLKINDFAIDSPDKAMQSFMSLKGQSAIRLDLLRDGRPLTLNYDIR